MTGVLVGGLLAYAVIALLYGRIVVKEQVVARYGHLLEHAPWERLALLGFVIVVAAALWPVSLMWDARIRARSQTDLDGLARTALERLGRAREHLLQLQDLRDLPAVERELREAKHDLGVIADTAWSLKRGREQLDGP